MSGEEGSAAHDEQMEEGGNGGEYAGREGGFWRDGGASDAVRHPIKELREHGDAENDGEVAEDAGAEFECSLLEAGVGSGGESDVEDLNQDNEQAAPGAGAQHGREVDDGASGCAEQGTLPVPTGGYPLERRGQVGNVHACIVRSSREICIKARLHLH